MKNKVIARHSWDISTYRTKTHQELKPLKAEVSTSFCSPCILQLLFKHTLCLHTLTELPSVPAQSSTIQTSTYCTVAEIFFCFSTKLVLPISDTPYLHRFTRLYTIMRKLLLSWFSSTVYGRMSTQSAIRWGKFVFFLSVFGGRWQRSAQKSSSYMSLRDWCKTK